MKKSKLILIMLTALLAILTACGKKAETVDAHSDWQTQYDAGARFLSELNYEEAIAAFIAAIDIDPKQTDAYLKLAEAYLAMEEPQKAADILTQGLEAASEPDRITEMLKEIKKLYPDTKIPSLDTGEQASDDVPDPGSDPCSDPVITAMEESIPAQYDFAAPFYEGFARVGRLTEDGSMKYFFINEAGKVISSEYDVALDFLDGMAVVGNYPSPEAPSGEENGNDSYNDSHCLYGYIDASGTEIIPLTLPGDLSGVRPYYFHDGLAEIAWYGEDGYIRTNLIDMKGTKQLPVDIVCEDYRGYGGGEEDPRILYLTQSRDYASDGWPLYTSWNPVQWRRIEGTGSWPLTVCDGENTLLLSENWEILSTEPGYRSDLSMYSDLEGLFLLYPSYSDTESGTLIDEEGNVLAENVRYADSGLNDRLIVCFPDNTADESYASVYALYSREGEKLSEDYAVLRTWSSGYIIMNKRSENWNQNGTFTVTDADLNELFTVQAANLYQLSSGFDVGDDAAPLFSRSYHADSSNYLTEYLNEAGQTVFPHEENTQLSLLTSDYVIRQRPDGVEIYTVDGRSVSTLPGIQNFGQVWTADGEPPLFSYTTVENMQNGIYDRTYVQMNEENGTLSFTEVAYNAYTGSVGTDSDASGKSILLENGLCALWGINDYSTPPVTLKRGDEEIDESAALSLIGNNLYKHGACIDEQPADYWAPKAADISLRTVDGSWQSDVYEDMGYLSCNHISFRKNGKWGYLKTVN